MIFNAIECNPLSDCIEGKLVVVGAEYFKPQFQNAKYQIVLATGGFGCYADKMGNAVFVTECCENPESYRQERYNLIGEPTEKMISEWKSLYGEFNDEVLKVLSGNN